MLKKSQNHLLVSEGQIHKQSPSVEHFLALELLDAQISLLDTLIQKRWAPTTKKSTEII